MLVLDSRNSNMKSNENRSKLIAAVLMVQFVSPAVAWLSYLLIELPAFSKGDDVDHHETPWLLSSSYQRQ
jgi:hypothetical protein